jgi:hypothetical protein
MTGLRLHAAFRKQGTFGTLAITEGGDGYSDNVTSGMIVNPSDLGDAVTIEYELPPKSFGGEDGVAAASVQRL